jgi:hypothetical protein
MKRLFPADLKIACSEKAEMKLSRVGSWGMNDGTPLTISFWVLKATENNHTAGLRTNTSISDKRP